MKPAGQLLTFGGKERPIGRGRKYPPSTGRCASSSHKLCVAILRAVSGSWPGQYTPALGQSLHVSGGASEGVIQQRLEAIESALQVATEGKKEEVSAFLSEMVLLLANFAAEPTAVGGKTVPSSAPVMERQETSPNRLGTATVSELLEQHYEIMEGVTGYTYERIFCPYIDTAASIQIEDPYIRLPHQVENFARFCALAIRLGSVKVIDLVSGLQANDSTDDADSRLETLRRDLQSRGIIFNWKRKTGLHDREIRFSNGWIIKIGRGLDIYHKPESWVSVEAADFSMRRCRQTKVDIFRESTNE